MKRGAKFEEMAAKVAPYEQVGVLAAAGLLEPAAEEELTRLAAEVIAEDLDAEALKDPAAFVELFDAPRSGQ